jgi:hypothetical protein
MATTALGFLIRRYMELLKRYTWRSVTAAIRPWAVPSSQPTKLLAPQAAARMLSPGSNQGRAHSVILRR